MGLVDTDKPRSWQEFPKERLWDTAISNCALELMNIPGNIRMAYSEWVWNEDKIEELEQFITFFNLKYV